MDTVTTERDPATMTDDELRELMIAYRQQYEALGHYHSASLNKRRAQLRDEYNKRIAAKAAQAAQPCQTCGNCARGSIWEHRPDKVECSIDQTTGGLDDTCDKWKAREAEEGN